MLHCCRWPGCNRLIQTYVLMCPTTGGASPKNIGMPFGGSRRGKRILPPPPMSTRSSRR